MSEEEIRRVEEGRRYYDDFIFPKLKRDDEFPFSPTILPLQLWS